MKIKVGFYRQRNGKTILLALEREDSGISGFIFNTPQYDEGQYSVWSSEFTEKVETYVVPSEIQIKILNKIKEKSFLLDVMILFNLATPFKITGKILENDSEGYREIIPISSISRVKEIDKNFIEINLFGEIKKVYFKDYESLIKIIRKEEL